jgi:hypothetical protein
MRESPHSLIDHAVGSILDSLDSLDVDSVLTHISDDARLSFGRSRIAEGKPAIRKVLIRTLGLLDSLHCAPVAVWTENKVAVVELDVAFERADGGGLTVPATIVLRFSGRAVSDVTVCAYVSAMPVGPRKTVGRERVLAPTAAAC